MFTTERAQFDWSFQDFRYHIFDREDLAGINFSHSVLRFSRFYKCDLRGVNFVGADLTGALFIDCDLTGVLITSLKLPSKLEMLELLAYAADNGHTYNWYTLLGSLIENPTAGSLLLAVRLPEIPREMLDSPVRSAALKEIEQQIKNLRMEATHA